MSWFSNILSGSAVSGLIQSLGANAIVSQVEKGLIDQAKTLGEAEVERLIEIPEATVTALALARNLDPATAIALRNAGAKAEADFMLYLATGATPEPVQVAS